MTVGAAVDDDDDVAVVVVADGVAVVVVKSHTCFADPVHVPVHFSLQFLLLFEEQKSGSALHSVFLFGKLANNQTRKREKQTDKRKRLIQ